MSESYAEIRKFIEETAVQAGERIREFYDKEEGWVKEKSKNNPLTEADLEANRIIQTAIQKKYPEDGWCSEETDKESHDFEKKRVWIVDPLDGTIEFTQRIPEFAVSIGLTEAEVPTLGVIYNPIKAELISGSQEEGVFLNGVKKNLSSSKDLKKARILVSGTEYKKGQVDFLKDVAEIVPMGGTANKLALVASGMYDGYVSVQPKNTWDYAAGVALLKAVGARVTNLEGDPLDLLPRKVNGFCIGDPAWHGEVLGLIQKNVPHRPISNR